MQMKARAIHGLDLIRFAAALAVVAYHLGYKAFAVADSTLHQHMGGPAALPGWSLVSWWGWIGVQVFFVLSGVVIAYSARNATPSGFAKGRFKRLFPAMLICASFIAVVAIVWEARPPMQVALLWAKSIVFFPQGPWLTGQFWTLPIEVVFYGFVWLMILCGGARRLEALAWALGLASAGYWLALSIAPDTDPAAGLTRLLTIQHGCYFALGVVLSVAARDGFTPGRATLSAICLATAWPQIVATTIAEHPGFGFEAWPHIPYAIWLIAVAGIAASIRWSDRIAGVVGGYAGAVRMVGLMTYPLYLIHMHTGGPVLIELLALGVSPALGVLAAAAMSCAAALVVVALLEPPAQRLVGDGLDWVQRRLSRREAQASR